MNSQCRDHLHLVTFKSRVTVALKELLSKDNNKNLRLEFSYPFEQYRSSSMLNHQLKILKTITNIDQDSLGKGAK